MGYEFRKVKYKSSRIIEVYLNNSLLKSFDTLKDATEFVTTHNKENKTNELIKPKIHCRKLKTTKPRVRSKNMARR